MVHLIVEIRLLNATSSRQCKCNANYFKNNDECRECPKNSNSPPDSTSIDQCTCSSNYFKDDNECKQCPPNAKLWYSEGAVDDVCKCHKNHYKSDFGFLIECKECPLNSNSPPNSTSIDQCTCNSNYFKHNNQ